MLHAICAVTTRPTAGEARNRFGGNIPLIGVATWGVMQVTCCSIAFMRASRFSLEGRTASQEARKPAREF
jgi:hypothetical protein